jgi:uncharacterized membrane protein YidH (DUF202 family)
MNCGIEGEYSFKFSNYARDLLYIMKLLASRTDRENMLFLIGMIVIIIGILALLLAYVFFPIQTADISIGQTVIPEISVWKYI